MLDAVITTKQVEAQIRDANTATHLHQTSCIPTTVDLIYNFTYPTHPNLNPTNPNIVKIQTHLFNP